MFALLILCSCTSLPQQNDRILTIDGVGLVKLGMSLAAAETALGGKIAVSYLVSGSLACGQGARADDLDMAVVYMVQNGMITRIDVLRRGVRTSSGIGIGSTEADVRMAYGSRIRTQPDPYGENGLEMFVNDSGDRRGMMFATGDQGAVTSLSVGLYPALRYIEGCA